ncbi:MAG: RNA methyltransferase [Oscillospiraceae bacterium]|nr:RNA methyltransferase [Oscillospiraceae bacterium]
MVNYIESKENPKIKNALKIANDASYRRKNGVFFASTSKVVLDILAAGFRAVSVFCLQEEYDKIADHLTGENVFIVSAPVAEKLSEGKTEDGVWALFEMKEADENSIFTADKLLVLEDVQDPTNIGAIMRTALAFGYENVAVSRKCADVYSRKVIRTSMTASVKLNVYKVGDMVQFTRTLNEKGFTTVATCLEGAQELGTVETPVPVALFIGNEGNGLSDDVIKSCKLRLKIPMSDRIESLNAAVSAAVLMWELRGR